jgi:alpha-L-fucosidase
VIDVLVDIVSRDGNLPLNSPLPIGGELDYEEMVILDEITEWMVVNREGFTGRGRGRSLEIAWWLRLLGRAGHSVRRVEPQGVDRRRYPFHDERKCAVRVLVEWPEKLTLIRPLATSRALQPPKINQVELLGYESQLRWTQDEQGLTVMMP